MYILKIELLADLEIPKKTALKMWEKSWKVEASIIWWISSDTFFVRFPQCNLSNSGNILLSHPLHAKLNMYFDQPLITEDYPNLIVKRADFIFNVKPQRPLMNPWSPFSPTGLLINVKYGESMPIFGLRNLTLNQYLGFINNGKDKNWIYAVQNSEDRKNRTIWCDLF